MEGNKDFCRGSLSKWLRTMVIVSSQNLGGCGTPNPKWPNRFGETKKWRWFQRLTMSQGWSSK